MPCFYCGRVTSDGNRIQRPLTNPKNEAKKQENRFEIEMLFPIYSPNRV